jgi:hypothetical protein
MYILDIAVGSAATTELLHFIQRGKIDVFPLKTSANL